MMVTDNGGKMLKQGYAAEERRSSDAVPFWIEYLLRMNLYLLFD